MGLWSVVGPLRSMFVVGFVAVALVAADAAGAPTAVCPGIAASFGGNGDLRGVAATSSRNVWAVGDGRGAHGHVTLVEHWNGKAWRARCSPDPSVSENFLNGVAALSSTNAWAVGRYRNSRGTSRTLVEHWDGKAWKVQPSPNSGGSLADNELDGVAAVSPTDAWAVGARFPSGGGRTLVEHWNGKAWKVQQSPNPGGSSNALAGVAATSPTNAWAVGRYKKGTTVQTLIEHWNGKAWKVQPSPNPGGSSNALDGVAATSSTNAWAVGRSKNGTTVQTLIEHWDGTAWTVQPSGTGGNHERLYGVAADSPSDAWAVGFANGRLQTLIEHWNGTAWTVQPTRGPAGSPQVLKGVAAVSPTAAWAVGRYDHGSEGFLTLIEAWNGTTWNH